MYINFNISSIHEHQHDSHLHTNPPDILRRAKPQAGFSIGYASVSSGGLDSVRRHQFVPSSTPQTHTHTPSRALVRRHINNHITEYIYRKQVLYTYINKYTCQSKHVMHICNTPWIAGNACIFIRRAQKRARIHMQPKSTCTHLHKCAVAVCSI